MAPRKPIESYERNGRTVAPHERRVAGGRPRIGGSGGRVAVTLYLPADVYDRCAREAIRRDVPLAQVLRECVMRMKPPSSSTPETR